METQPANYRSPKSALDTLRTLAGDIEKVSSALLRAIDALETSLAPVPNASEDRFSDLVKRFDGVVSSLGQITTRIAALESDKTAVVTGVPSTQSDDATATAGGPPDGDKPSVAVAAQNGVSADHAGVGEDASQADGAMVVPNKRAQHSYSMDIRKMAVDMRRKGKSSDAIILAIHKKCGYAPDKSNLSTYINRWERSVG